MSSTLQNELNTKDAKRTTEPSQAANGVPLLIAFSNPHLDEKQFEPTELANYSFTIQNTSKTVVLKNIKVNSVRIFRADGTEADNISWTGAASMTETDLWPTCPGGGCTSNVTIDLQSSDAQVGVYYVVPTMTWETAPLQTQQSPSPGEFPFTIVPD